jgi:hypothetical protein
MGDPFGSAARQKLAGKGGRIPSGRPEPVAAPAEPPEADAPTYPAGFGGGPSVAVPEGESLGDAVRRQVFGG